MLVDSTSFHHQFYKDYATGLAKEMKGMPQKCPIKPGSYFDVDRPIKRNKYSTTDTTADANKKFLVDIANLPNGFYRIKVELSVEDDPQAGVVAWQYEIKNRLNFGHF